MNKKIIFLFAVLCSLQCMMENPKDEAVPESPDKATETCSSLYPDEYFQGMITDVRLWPIQGNKPTIRTIFEFILPSLDNTEGRLSVITHDPILERVHELKGRVIDIRIILDMIEQMIGMKIGSSDFSICKIADPDEFRFSIYKGIYRCLATEGRFHMLIDYAHRELMDKRPAHPEKAIKVIVNGLGGHLCTLDSSINQTITQCAREISEKIDRNGFTLAHNTQVLDVHLRIADLLAKDGPDEVTLSLVFDPVPPMPQFTIHPWPKPQEPTELNLCDVHGIKFAGFLCFLDLTTDIKAILEETLCEIQAGIPFYYDDIPLPDKFIIEHNYDRQTTHLRWQASITRRCITRSTRRPYIDLGFGIESPYTGKCEEWQGISKPRLLSYVMFNAFPRIAQEILSSDHYAERPCRKTSG